MIVLTETSAGEGTRVLIDGLRRRGYAVFGCPEPGERGVLLATRLPVSRELGSRMSVTLPTRVAGVTLATSPRVTVLGVYVPSRDRSPMKIARKEAFIESLIACVEGFPKGTRDQLMLAGDYNAIPRSHTPPRSGFFEYEYGLHEELARFGLVGAHELFPTHAHPHSWIGRTGNGYLYDYVHVGARLHENVTRCAYLHGPRTRRLSDHAAVVVGWQPKAA